MLPLRLVFDTNLIVSAALKPNSLPRTALQMALMKPSRLYVSTDILFEYEEVLRRPELFVAKGVRHQLLQLIRNEGHIVKPTGSLHVCADPDDDVFLECADASRADYLVTGNVRHFPKYWKSTKVVTAREFLDLVAPHLLG